MGNGQNRRRRGGAHTRNGPHRSVPPVNDRRGATHVMPTTPAAEASASDDGEEELASALPDETPTGEAQGAAGEAEPERPAPAAPHSSTASEPAEAATPALEASGSPEASAATEEVVEPEAPEPEQRAPRGRFERFYAPGQQKRPASNGQHSAANGAGENSASGNGHHASPAHTSHAIAGDDDEETQVASGPRADVRGPVGDLIDALHEIFVRDRAVASQGGISRCGICYLHYPLAELVYHDSEGFYVCQTCERALGGARVNMVRRQQRQ